MKGTKIMAFVLIGAMSLGGVMPVMAEDTPTYNVTVTWNLQPVSISYYAPVYIWDGTLGCYVQDNSVTPGWVTTDGEKDQMITIVNRSSVPITYAIHETDGTLTGAMLSHSATVATGGEAAAAVDAATNPDVATTTLAAPTDLTQVGDIEGTTMVTAAYVDHVVLADDGSNTLAEENTSTNQADLSYKVTIGVLTPAPAFSVSPTEASIAVGATTTLEAANASGTVTWSSDNETVATVDSAGVVTGAAAGTAIITAKDEAENTVTISITVTE